MKVFQFDLVFEVPSPPDANPKTWASQYLDLLGEHGCTDATIGSGQPGILSIHFDSEAESIDNAIQSAIQRVTTAIPAASLLKSSPTLS